MSTIFKTILQENLMQDNQEQNILKGIIEKNTDGNNPFVQGAKVNAQAIFDEIAGLDGWTTPTEGNEETLLEYFDPAFHITLHDGTPAGLAILKREGKYFINVLFLNN